MAAQSQDRVDKLNAMLAKSPGDAFLVYALGMEHKKTDLPKAAELFQQVIQLDAGQCYAYFQLGQTRELMSDIEGAKEAYREGIDAAERHGDAHAQSELTGALEMIES